MPLYFLPPLIIQKLAWIPTRVFLWLFVRLEVKGLENLQGVSRSVIFACNHVSQIDQLMVPASLPLFSRFSPVFYVTRDRSFYATLGWKKYLFDGLFINAVGGYTAPSGLRDYSKSLVRHENIVNDGYSLCVFPEGGITKDGSIQPAKGGIGYLAWKTGATIIPVHIIGMYGLNDRDFFTGKGRVSVVFGKSMNYAEFTSSTVTSSINTVAQPSPEEFKAFANEVMKRVGELF